MRNPRSTVQIWLAGLSAIALVGCASVPIPKLDKTQTPDPKDIETVRQDVDGAQRAAAISWRMAVSGREYCGEYAENALPFVIGAVPAQTSAGEKLAYWKTYQIEEGSVYIAGILDPEVDAKLRYDRIVSIGDTPRSEPISGGVLELLRTESARGTLSLTLARAGKVSIPLKNGCRGYFALVRGDKPTAAIGEKVIVMSTGLSRYATSDDELAFVVGRELALNNSNALGNIKAATYAGAFATGILRAFVPLPMPFGGGGALAGAAVRSAYEGDADRGAFDLMLKAGYDPRVVPAFWARVEKDEKSDHKALRASDGRKKAWDELVAAVPQEKFDQIAAARHVNSAQSSVNAPTVVKIHSIVQLEPVEEKYLPAAQ